ncbi:T9SS type A sorting domain-containing protein [candidate division TA06 bacterium]|uniref:T9SS type A sorting domain-containing protein n=1 Tax=candidate division TA06 bacterium TaxID=2250710 RepID=A0A933IA49_UNCT6|nr:T9SS type A sorting domain-containing protein [candidate division TA06 bacterium]
MKKIICAIALTLALVLPAQAVRIWRSDLSGYSWNTPSAWVHSDNNGLTWDNSDSTYPNAATDSLITIDSTHIVTVAMPITVDQLLVKGMLTQNATITVNDGPGGDIVVTGAYERLADSLVLNPGAAMIFGPNSYYYHYINGREIPAATWDSLATLYINGVTSTMPTGMDQAFGNIEWSCYGQTVDMTLPGGASFTARNLSVTNTSDTTGMAHGIYLTSGAKPSLTVNNFKISGNSKVILGSGGSRNLHVKGDFATYDPGWLYLTDTLKAGIDTLFLYGNYSHLVAGIGGGGPDSTAIVFCGADTQYYNPGGEILTGYINYQVNPGSVLKIPEGTTFGMGSLGDFALMPGATLAYSDYWGIYPTGQDTGVIRVFGSRNYSQGANYHVYSSTTGPYYTGPGLPDTVNQLTIESYGDQAYLNKDLAVMDTLKLLVNNLRFDGKKLSLFGPIYQTSGNLVSDSLSVLAVMGGNPAGLKLPFGIQRLGTLIVNRPALITTSDSLDIYSGYMQISGKIGSGQLRYKPNAILTYNSTVSDTTSDREFPIINGPLNLTVQTAAALQLHADRTIKGTLTLNGALSTGANILTLDKWGMVVQGAGFVSGHLSKLVPAAADTVINYELGTVGSGKSPVTVRIFNNTVPAFVTAGVYENSHPSVGDGSSCLKKYWSLWGPGLAADACQLTFYYGALDFNPPKYTESAHEPTMVAARYDYTATPGWQLPAIIARNPGTAADGGSVVINHAGNFATNPEFTLARDSAAIFLPPVDTLSFNLAGGAYRMFSVPVSPFDSTISRILGDDLGAYSDTTWRIFGYKPSSDYAEQPYIFSGYGYWLATTNDALIDADGYVLLNTFNQPIDGGWNLIGDPFDTTVTLANITVLWNDTASHSLNFTDSTVNDVVRQKIYNWRDDSPDFENNGVWDSLIPYNVGDQMRPWMGYALYALRPCTLMMERFRGQKSDKPAQAPQCQIDWQLALDVSSGTAVDRGLKLGVSPQASQTYDRLDAEKPPLIFHTVKAFIPHQDWNQGPCRSYQYDFRPPADYIEWPLVIETAQADQPVVLTAQISGELGNEGYLYLLDRRRGKTFDLKTQKIIGFSGSQELAVVYSSKPFDGRTLTPLTFGLGRIGPNPFIQRTTINYQLPQAGLVSMAVYNITGQRVRTLLSQNLPPGYYSQIWDGRNDGGRALSAGVYIVRLSASGRSAAQKIVKLQ